MWKSRPPSSLKQLSYELRVRVALLRWAEKYVNIFSQTPSQTPSSLVIKRLRGYRANQKDDENDDSEFNTEFAQIEKDLNQRELVTFKMFERDMTFEWRDGINREIASDMQLKGLKASV